MKAPEATKLAPHVIEALAHDRLDLLSARERAEVDALRAADGAALERVVASARESSHAFSRALPRAVDDLDVDALVSTAMARAELATERASARTLAIGATLGVLFATVSGLVGLTTNEGGTLEPIRRAAALARAGVTLSLATGRALDAIPGGAAGVALLLLGGVSSLVWLARRLDGPLRAALPLLLLLSFVPTYAHAYDLEGALPPAPAVHVDADHAPRSIVLAEAARSVGLGLVYTLPEDPPVTLHVEGAPLAEVLEAVLPPEATVRASEHLLTVQARRVPLVTPEMPSPPPIPPPPDAPGRSVELHDMLTFGGDARVAPGQEVRDVITMGGDARVEGRTYGSVVTMGGDADVSGVVVGDVVTMGGDIRVRDTGVVHGRLDSLGGEVQIDAPERGIVSSAQPLAIGARPGDLGHAIAEEDGGLVWAVLRYSLLFLAAILFLGLAPERFGRVQRAIVERPVRTLATGTLGIVTGGVIFVALVVSLIGIPIALVLAIVAPVAAAAALASVVPVIGAMLPTQRLEGRPVARLAAGAAVLFVVTRIPLVGSLAIALALLAGLGALVLTRFGARDANERGL